MTNTLASLYPAHVATLKARHDKALAASGFDHFVAFAGNPHTIFLDDMDYPFKANPHVKYWAPVVDNPFCFVVYTPGERPKFVYNRPVDYWHKVAGEPEGYWVSQFDIVSIATPEEAKQHMPTSGRCAFVGEWDPNFDDWAFEAANPPALLNQLHFDRAMKTPYEAACMRAATVKGVRAHLAAADAFAAGASEFEIHLEYLRASGHMEHELPYGNIIAMNRNAAVLHYMDTGRDPLGEAERHSFLIDAGAQVNGYACDITRTWAQRNDEFAALVAAVDAMQLRLVAMVNPGVDYKSIHLATHLETAKILADFGLVTCSPEAAVEKRISSAFFPHGVGHLIGLQVHDVAGFAADASGTMIPKPEGHPYLRLTRIIEKDMAFTIEPGIYFIDSLLDEVKKGPHAKDVAWEKVAAFHKYGGIRIEDDVLVTDSGVENLTRDEWARQES
jgi:Xaa-Pro dipeptidase